MIPSKKILLLCPLFGASLSYYSSLFESITKQAQKYGYQIIIQPVNVNHKQSLSSYYHPLSEIEGIIAITCQVESSSWLTEAKAIRIPMVLVHDNIEDSKLEGTSVVSSIKPELHGLRDLVDHLIQDHYVRNPSCVMVDPRGHAIRQEKFDILEREIKKNGLTFNKDKQIFYIPGYTIEDGKKIVSQILKTNPGTDAIISLGDATAVGIQDELEEQRVSGILVTGFDNNDLTQQFDITSVDQHLETIGETAIVDLNNAIEHKIFALKKSTYIPTTLVKRSSCCKPAIPEIISHHPLPRFSIYFTIEDENVLNAVDNIRKKIYEIKDPLVDPMTIKFLGKAPLYPLHVTIRGIFQIKSKESLTPFLLEIREAIESVDSFTIEAAELMNFPPPRFLSFGFTDESNEKLRGLQSKINDTIAKYRKTDATEPEYRNYLFSTNQKEKEYTERYGEPFLNDQFIPHASLISGIENNHEYETIKKYIEEDYEKLKPIRFGVKKIAVVYETTLGGKWEILNEYYTKE